MEIWEKVFPPNELFDKSIEIFETRQNEVWWISINFTDDEMVMNCLPDWWDFWSWLLEWANTLA